MDVTMEILLLEKKFVGVLKCPRDICVWIETTVPYGTTVFQWHVLHLETTTLQYLQKMASPASSRGYPVNFVKQPPKEMPAECPICLHVLYRPKVVSCCGHSFCAVCIGWVASDHKPCPLCGQQLTLTDNKWLEWTLNDYDVYCRRRDVSGQENLDNSNTTSTKIQYLLKDVSFKILLMAFVRYIMNSG